MGRGRAGQALPGRARRRGDPPREEKNEHPDQDGKGWTHRALFVLLKPRAAANTTGASTSTGTAALFTMEEALCRALARGALPPDDWTRTIARAAEAVHAAWGAAPPDVQDYIAAAFREGEDALAAAAWDCRVRDPGFSRAAQGLAGVCAFARELAGKEPEDALPAPPYDAVPPPALIRFLRGAPLGAPAT